MEGIEFNSFWNTVLNRRSIRRYSDQPVSQALLERLLTAAIWAPNAHNRQPWRFAVVTSVEKRQRLSKAMAGRWQEDLLADGLTPELAQRRSNISRQRIGTAGALVAGCLTMTEMDTYTDEERQFAEHMMAVQSTSLALGNLLLAAQHEGLAACWMCAPLFVPEIVCAVLDLPSDWQPQALITLGYPAETREKTRKALDEVVVWR